MMVHVCYRRIASLADGRTGILACSQDDGATWSTREPFAFDREKA